MREAQAQRPSLRIVEATPEGMEAVGEREAREKEAVVPALLTLYEKHSELRDNEQTELFEFRRWKQAEAKEKIDEFRRTVKFQKTGKEKVKAFRDQVWTKFNAEAADFRKLQRETNGSLADKAKEITKVEEGETYIYVFDPVANRWLIFLDPRKSHPASNPFVLHTYDIPDTGNVHRQWDDYSIVQPAALPQNVEPNLFEAEAKRYFKKGPGKIEVAKGQLKLWSEVKKEK